MKHITYMVIMLCLSANCYVENSYALSKPTHQYINGAIIEKKLHYDLVSHLKNNLLFTNGIDERFERKKVIDHIKDGGLYEDEPNGIRNMNHFQDPLEDNWPDAGWRDGLSVSAATWAQGRLQNVYDWPDARDYFYNALTAHGTDAELIREYGYANTFRSLGQLMHLVQDMSVPSHTRIDTHVLFTYEGWVETFRTKDKTAFDAIIAAPTLALSPTLTSRINYNADATIPIAGLFDTDTYTGTNPGITPFNSVGLAEYTNANFFSEDTIFKTSDYPYPSRSSVAVVDFPVPVPYQPGKSIYRPYYYKSGDGDAGYPLATVSYLVDYAHKYIPDYIYAGDYFYKFVEGKEMPALDSTCYQAYARRLLPRAVAYSSELLRYFFRGDVEAVDASATQDADGDITGMKMKVKNATADEGIADGGNIVVSCRYKPADATEYSYTKSAEAAMSPLASGATSDAEYEFSFPDPIPSGATDIQYTLVYRGQLGAEADAVAAKADGFKASKA